MKGGFIVIIKSMKDVFSPLCFAHKNGLPGGLRPIIFGGLLGLASWGAWADGSVERDSEYPFESLPVVLSASRLHQSTLEAPAAVTVIDREALVASGARRLADVLRLVPGFQVGYLSGNGTVVAYHGLSDFFAKRMQVLVDGVSIYTPLLGGVDWNMLQLTLEDVDRIEVVRGPNAVTYGANTFLAVINIITRDPATETGSQVFGNVGGGGIRDLAFRTARQADSFRYSLSMGQRYDDGLPNIADWSRVNLFNFRAHHRLDEHNELMMQLRASGGRAQSGGVVSRGFYNINIGPGQFDPVRERAVAQEVLQMRWTRAESVDDEFWLQFHHHQQRMRENSNVVLPLPNGTGMPYGYLMDRDQTRDDLEYQQTARLNDWLRLVAGGQLRVDAARSFAMLNRRDWVSNRLARVFANLEASPLEDLRLQGGMMVENNSISGTSLSPRLVGIWFLTPEQSFRAGATLANRAPTLNEEYGSLIYHAPAALQWLTQGRSLATLALSSGGLRDERIFSREIGYTAEFSQWQLGGDLRLFKDRIDHLITLNLTHPVVTMTNNMAWDYSNSSDSLTVRGVELSLRWRPWSGAMLQGSGAYTRIASKATQTVAQRDERSAPRTTWNFLFQQNLPEEFDFSAGYYRIASMQWQSATETLPAYDALDLRLSKRFHWQGQTLEVAVVTRNVLGGYSSYKTDVVDRRVSFLQLNASF